MGDARAVEPLNKIINFEFEMDNVREAATRALQKIGGKPIHAATIHQVYSFIAANILLTASKPEDQQLIQRILAYASKNLSENKPNFKKLYEAVENENSPHLLGTGMAASPKVFSEAFTGWIKSRGISINDYASLVDKQIFILAGDATNPQNGQSFPWGVFIYFDLESKELTSRKTDSHNPFVFRNGQKAYAVEDLARICREAPADALFHLLEGHFEPWLTYIGRDDLAQRAKSARLSSGSDETRLSAFLGAI
jgi:hypothetical protein